MHFQQEALREAVHLECIVGRLEEHRTPHGQGRELVLGKFGLVWFRAIFAGPETGRSGP